MQYRIKEKSENPLESVIEKTGHVITFTLAEVQQVEASNEKTVKELKAKREVEAAKISNIESHHPFVLEMSEQDMLTVWMYYEAKGMLKMADGKLAEFEKNHTELEEELKEIKAQIPELYAQEESK